MVRALVLSLANSLVVSNPAVAYAKSKALLGVHFELVDLDLVPQGEALQDALAELAAQSSLPNVFIGGNSDVQELHAKEQLVPLLKANDALA
ncbi:hypothetical protein Gpo141_00008391 [Globisporangium polare]